jgi:NAD(P) transhydrogenase subunit alpha
MLSCTKPTLSASEIGQDYLMMKIGVIKEIAGETRVSATPTTVKSIIDLGYQVVVEAGAGTLSTFPDSAYVAAGATIGSTEEALASQVVLKVAAPSNEEISKLSDNAIVVSLMTPSLRPELLESLATRGITALALDAVPRISRA